MVCVEAVLYSIMKTRHARLKALIASSSASTRATHGAEPKEWCTKMRSKKYEVIMYAAILYAVCFMNAQTSYANPPQDVKSTYDSASQMLTVTITHKSSFPSFHYIKIVEIRKNGNLVSTNRYEDQPDQATFAYSYKVPAATGDILEANAHCSLYGSKSTTLTVGK
jgi:hypothetical protein